jgi:drug/metabolite transporter (DMT)-like permease
MDPPQKEINLIGMLNLSVVYVVWGSTYLAIRVGVRQGAGFPPFTFGGMRMLSAGVLLLLSAFIFGKRLKLSRRDFGVLAASGVLLWTGGNGLVTWAEQHTDSGLAALLISALPLWVMAIESVWDRRLPSWRLVVALLVGFSGVSILSAPVLMSGVKADVLSIIALLFAGISWGTGTVIQARNPVQINSQVSSGYQQIFGGIGFMILVLAFHEPRPSPISEAWIALGYLVVVGSIIGFTAFVQAVRLLPTNIVMTYAYVNPIIAVLLGRVILQEPITWWTIAGAILVMIGVAGVFRERQVVTRYAHKG